MDQGYFEFNPLAFFLGAAIGAQLFAQHRAQSAAAADLAVLREARAIDAVHQEYGYTTPEQAQVLYRAGEIEREVDGWRRHNDAQQGRGALTALAWVAGFLVLLALANIPGINPLVVWAGDIDAGVAVFQRVEAWRQEAVAARRELTGRHGHGGFGHHSHPHSRRHRHHGGLDGPLY